MRRLAKNLFRSEKGCTFIELHELLVVVAIVFIIAAIVVPNLGAFSGTDLVEQEQQHIDAARAVAEDIPLPTWYCPVHGVAGEPRDIEVEIIGYNTSTGEPLLNITCKVVCPEVGFWSRGISEHVHRFYLCFRSGGGIFYEYAYLKKIPLCVLLDDTVIKTWR